MTAHLGEEVRLSGVTITSSLDPDDYVTPPPTDCIGHRAFYVESVRGVGSASEAPLAENQIRLEADGASVVLTIHDSEAVVAEVVAATPDSNLPDPIEVTNPDGDRETLLVRWGAYPCELDTSLSLARGANDWVLTLDRSVPENCEAMGVVYGVLLHLSEPIDADELVIKTTPNTTSDH
jgi:hypothetical protein